MRNPNDYSGSAFPMPDQYAPDGRPIMEGALGMTKREVFAMHALAGYIAMHAHEYSGGPPPPEGAANAAVAYADALIAALLAPLEEPKP